MNKTAIEWCDYTWNPVTGCLHGCSYCYARKIAERFKGSKAWPQGFDPMFHPDRLNDPTNMKKPQTVFVCSMADLFGDWVPDEWIRSVMEACDRAPHHTYVFLTKNPKRYLTIPGDYFKKNRWFGTTITNQADANARLHWLNRIPEGNLFVSFEPLLEQLTKINLDRIGQVIIGAQTNPSIEVTPEMIQPIGAATCPGCTSSTDTPTFFKDSLPQWAKLRRELAWNLNKPKVAA